MRTTSTKSVRLESAVVAEAESTAPNVESLTSAGVQVRPHRSEAPPKLTKPGVVIQNAPAELLLPLTVPPLTSLTELSETVELMAVKRSHSTWMPLIVASRGRANPKFVALR